MSTLWAGRSAMRKPPMRCVSSPGASRTAPRHKRISNKAKALPALGRRWYAGSGVGSERLWAGLLMSGVPTSRHAGWVAKRQDAAPFALADHSAENQLIVF